MLPKIENRFGLFWIRRLADAIAAVLIVLSLQTMYWGLLIVLPAIWIYKTLLFQYSYDKAIGTRVFVVFIALYINLLLIVVIPKGTASGFVEVMMGIGIYVSICSVLGRIIIPLPWFFVFRKFDYGEADTAFFAFLEAVMLCCAIYGAGWLLQNAQHYGYRGEMNFLLSVYR